MPFAQFNSIAITGMEVCVGPESHSLEHSAAGWGIDHAQLEKVRRAIGVENRVVAPKGITTLDLCEQAARRLFAGTGLDSASLDAVFCVTQTPDHLQPSNANILHGRLGLRKPAAAFDVNQGCSGWVYGLYLANCMIAAGGCQRVLLLAGDTVTQNINPGDRATVPLFGDAGSATLVERVESASSSWFSLCSDGQGWQAIWVPAGGYRQSHDAQTGEVRKGEDGSCRSANDLHMNGIEVFNFTLREEPRAVQELLAYAGRSTADVDFFVFHQANRMILENLATRLRVPRERVPSGALACFGNLSSASVPSALCHDLGANLRERASKVLCSGFGVGLSWASCLLELGPLTHCGLGRYASNG